MAEGTGDGTYASMVSSILVWIHVELLRLSSNPISAATWRLRPILRACTKKLGHGWSDAKAACGICQRRFDVILSFIDRFDEVVLFTVV